MRIVGHAIVVLTLLLTGPAPSARAQDLKSSGGPGEVNACGCYRDETGVCRCQKKGKCACPGECEPVGCEAKREKEAAKAADAEMKRIAAREKKRAADAAKAAKAKKKNAKSQPGADAR